jgi:hypothetical protein
MLRSVQFSTSLAQFRSCLCTDPARAPRHCSVCKLQVHHSSSSDPLYDALPVSGSIHTLPAHGQCSMYTPFCCAASCVISNYFTLLSSCTASSLLFCPLYTFLPYAQYFAAPGVATLHKLILNSQIHAKYCT